MLKTNIVGLKIDGKKNLIITPIIFILVDTIFTLYFQPKEYWDSFNNSNNSIEWSPIFKLFLEISPTAFIFGVFSYAIIIITVIYVLNNNLAVFFSLTIILLHSNAIVFWLLSKNIISYTDFVLITVGISLILYNWIKKIPKTFNNI